MENLCGRAVAPGALKAEAAQNRIARAVAAFIERGICPCALRSSRGFASEHGSNPCASATAQRSGGEKKRRAGTTKTGSPESQRDGFDGKPEGIRTDYRSGEVSAQIMFHSGSLALCAEEFAGIEVQQLSLLNRAAYGPNTVGCAFCHSSLVTLFFSWRWTKVPFLFPTTMSGRPSPFISAATTCVPTPELSSMR